MLLPENASKIFIAVNAKTSKVVVRHFENTVIVKGLSAGWPKGSRLGKSYNGVTTFMK